VYLAHVNDNDVIALVSMVDNARAFLPSDNKRQLFSQNVWGWKLSELVCFPAMVGFTAIARISTLANCSSFLLIIAFKVIVWF
jgi:hypothetical protein